MLRRVVNFEPLGREVFGHLLEAKVLGTRYREEYNTERPHISVDFQSRAEYYANCVAVSVLTPAPV